MKYEFIESVSPIDGHKQVFVECSVLFETPLKEFPKSSAGVRTVVFPDDYTWLCSKIKMLNPFGEYIFVDDNGEWMTKSHIRRRQEKNCRKLGIYQKSPNKIRKTYGTILLNHNVDKRLIMEQMGHTDISCTENHYHSKQEEHRCKKPDYKQYFRLSGKIKNQPN